MDTRFNGRTASIAVLAAIGLLALVPAAGQAATFTVNTTDDGSDESCDAEHCTLREAIEAASGTEGDNTVIVPAGLYLLNNGRLNIFGGEGAASSVTVTGAGAASTIIDAQGWSRVLKVHSGAVANVAGVTMRGGYYYYGGAVRVNGTLTLTDSEVSFSQTGGEGGGPGGGIANDGDLTLVRTRVARNGADGDGGGLVNYGDARIVDSTFEGNLSSNNGGAVASYGDISISGSTLNGNASETDGGALYVSGTEFCCERVHVEGNSISNSTISGNDADVNLGGAGDGGGIYVIETTLDVVNSTIARNQSYGDEDGGGIATGINGSPGVITVRNTIVADNRVDQGADDCGGGIFSNGGNLESGEDCGFTGSGDRQNADPALGALTDNGGPTETHALLGGSDAIDAALADGCPDRDQRGGERPPPTGSAGSACDIGAFEAGSLGDLRMAFKSAAPSPATVGERLTYTMLAVNDGPDTVTGARVTDDLPAGLTFVSASSTSGSCSGTDVVVCDLGPLASGASALITIVVEPTAAGVVSNSASVGAAVTDVEHGNDVASVDVAVNAAGAPPIVPPDLTAPRLNLSTRTTKASIDQLLKGIVASGGCSDGCSLRFRLLVAEEPGNIQFSRFNRVLSRAYRSFSTSTRTVRLRPCVNKRTRRQSPTCLRRLRRNLKNAGPLSALVEAIATGSNRVKTRQIRRLQVR